MTERDLLDPAALTADGRARRDRIVIAALELLHDRDFDVVQMREVAEASKVSTATLYRHFSSKEHLYAVALLTWIVEFRDRTRRRPSGATDADRLRSLLRRTIHAFADWPRLWRTEIALEGSSDPNARAVYEEFAAVHQNLLAGCLTDVDPDDALAIVRTANSVLGIQLRKWATGRTSLAEVQRAVDDAVRLVFDGPRPASTGRRARTRTITAGRRP